MTMTLTDATIATIATIDSIAVHERDPMRRMAARLVQLTLCQAAEAGEDGYIYRRHAWRLARGLV